MTRDQDDAKLAEKIVVAVKEYALIASPPA
jgi:hypothetical protein